MIGVLTGFVDELRAVGVPVSMVEAIDAAEALRYTDLGDRNALRATLAATLVKSSRHSGAFDSAFDVFFGLAARPADADDDGSGEGSGEGGGAGGGDGLDGDELLEAIADALARGDDEALRRLVRQAVDQFSGMEPGRPVGGRYYLYRVMRRLDSARLLQRLLGGSTQVGAAEDGLEWRVERERAERLVEALQEEIRQEILRRLVADRGAEAVARTLRVPLVEDIDLMHATREELDEIELAIGPLARKLASRVAQRRKRGDRGRLDVRRTIRRSLEYGGALVDPRFKPPRRSKPELVLLCDVSGSMATFARFTMQLTYAMQSEFSRVRAFAFIDGLDEVTQFFGTGTDFHDGIARMSREADLVRRDGHSDYGRSFAEFAESHAPAVTPRSTVIITGDARNNYRDSGADVLGTMTARARALFWLNPEADRYWDTGDSIMSTYAEFCDSVDQVRTLRELETFVERIVLPAHRAARIRPFAPVG